MQRFGKSHKTVIQVFSAVKDIKGTIREEELGRPEYGVFNLRSCKLRLFNTLVSNCRCLYIQNFSRIFKDY